MAVMNGERWRELEPLLDHALELSDEERALWLSDVCARTPDVGTDLAAMLSGEAVADQRGFLNAPLIAEQPSLSGLVLGAYTLEHPLGRGGMGSVWLARRSDGRYAGRAAVKLLHLALLTPSGEARFRREGSLLARLTHPGIARLLDAGVSRDGQPYYVLEYVEGQPIDTFASSHHLSADDRLRLFLQVLEAVGHAHANLIVHRDLKPSNILVSPSGAVKLLDFGIAKLLEPEPGLERPPLTSEGGAAFTPEYAAPEQMTGGVITTATDVYALGVLLYLLISGRHPTAEGCKTPMEMAQALSNRQPAPLGLGDLGAVVEKALRKTPSERYQTVATFAADVRGYLAGDPVSARRSSVIYRARKALRRHAAASAIAAAVALALVAATVFSLRQMEAARRERDAAVFAGKQTTAQVEFLSVLMAQLGSTPLTMRELVDRGRIALQKLPVTDPRLRVSLLLQLSERYSELEETKLRGQLLQQADSIAVANGYRTELANVRCNRSDNLRYEGRYAEARDMLANADSLLGPHPDPATEASCLQYRADFQVEAGRAEDAIPLMQRSMAIRDSLGSPHGLEYVDQLADYAMALDDGHQQREGVVAHARVNALLDSAGLGTTMTSMINEHNLALVLFKLGETAESERVYRDAVVRSIRTDPSGRLPEQLLIHIAHAALFQQDYDTADKYFGMLATEAAADTNTYWQGRALFGLAESQIGSGHLADARRTMARFRPISANPDLRSSDDHLVDYRVLEAQLAAASGQQGAAQQLVTDALRTAGYFAGKRRSTFRSTLVFAAELAISTGDPRTAVTLARDARTVATRDSLTLTQSALVGEARLVEGRALLASGDTTQARAALALAETGLETGAGADHPRTREARRLLESLGRAPD